LIDRLLEAMATLMLAKFDDSGKQHRMPGGLKRHLLAHTEVQHAGVQLHFMQKPVIRDKNVSQRHLCDIKTR
jgi:hypothetical protein